jgi:hypothetical protein
MARSRSTTAEPADAAVEIGDVEGQALAAFARAAIREALGGPAAIRPDGEWAQAEAATFVTLFRDDGELQGCIGSIEPRRALVDDVAHNAVHAAVDDPRGTALALDDVERLTIELSLLGPLEPLPLPTATEADAALQLRPGVDGVVLRDGFRRATFLPDVWASLPDPAQLLWHLKRKAGLPRDLWSPSIVVYRYSVRRWFDRPHTR